MTEDANTSEIGSISGDDDEVVGGPLIEGNPTVAARALLLGVFLLMAGNGLQGSLLGVRTEAEGFSLAAAGIVMACYFAGFLFGSRSAEKLLGQVGHIRVFAALASSASAAVLMHSVFISPVTWGLMRFVTGMCMAGLFVVSESWLNDMATNATRGRLLSLYMVATMGGMTVGQFLLEAADPSGFKLFVLASILVSASLLPVTLSASSSPPTSIPEPLSFRELYWLVPTGVISSFWGGMSAGVLIGLGAVYAVAADLPGNRIPTFLAAPLIGSFLLQWPIGWISDRMSRRTVMLWVAVAASGVCAGLFAAPAGSWTAIVLMFLLGGTTFPLYSLTIAFAGDWLPQSQLTAASATLVRVNGVGAVFGPLVAAGLMAITSPRAFFAVMIATHALIASYIAWRVLFRDALPVERQRAFVAYPARASAVASNLIGRRRRSQYAESAADDAETAG
ncbi:MAG: MFS transporter [Acidimicrobiales bacterium]|jgi:MFS family permease|nr:MFS transporter [Acidimicrobiales bacterium]